MSEIVPWVLLAVVGTIALFLAALWIGARREGVGLRVFRAAAENQVAVTEAVLARAEGEIAALQQHAATSTQTIEGLRASEAVAQQKVAQAEEERQRMVADREDLRLKFESLAGRIFEEKEAASQRSIQQVLEPFKDQLKAFRTRIDEVHTAGTTQSGELRGELRQLHSLNVQLQKEAESLARALKNEPQTRGRWGELILERTFEIAGLEKGRDYRLQVSEGSSRLDAVVFLPDGRRAIVDSKVPLNHYTAYCDALVDEEKGMCLKALTSAVRNFIDDLARKDYSALLEGKSPDFILMLIPVEPAFAAAFKADESLMDYALSKKIIPTSTASLVATLRIIENLWRIDAQNKNVSEIASEGAKLLHYIDTFVEELGTVGDVLRKAGEIHLKAVERLTMGGQGSIKGTAERLKELGVRMTAGPKRRRGAAAAVEGVEAASADAQVAGIPESPEGEAAASSS